MKKEELFKILVPAFKDAILFIKKYNDENRCIPNAYEYLKMEYFETGLPHFIKVDWEKSPKNYYDVFDKTFEKELPKSWTDFYFYIMNDDYLTKYWKLKDEYNDNSIPFYESLYEFTCKFRIFGVIKNIVNRYIHEYNSFEFDLNKLKSIYYKWESAIFDSTLLIDILVPILCVKFDFDSFEINNNISVVKIEDKIQLARNFNLNLYTITPNKTVLGAATHGLLLKNWFIDNRDYEFREHLLYEIDAFSNAIPYIDNFFASLRLATDIESGYAQVIILPQSWFDFSQNDLPQIYKLASRSYPNHLDNFGWLKENKTITEVELSKVEEIYKLIDVTNDSSIQLAIKRLNSAYLRQDDEDTILDITIGLEALLTSDNNSEITHKLATRLAALNYLDNYKNYLPYEIFKIVKKIYSYRSSIVHGTSRKNKDKEIKISEKENLPTLQVALELFRYTLRTLLKNPQYLNLDELDKLLLNNIQSIKQEKE